MSQGIPPPRIVMKGVQANNNGGDGIRIEHDASDIQMEAVGASGNDGDGISVLAPEPPKKDGSQSATNDWHKRPIGMIAIGIVIAVLGALTLLAIKHYFPTLGL